MGSLLPAEEQEPSYAQLYIYDPQEATDRHIQQNSELSGPVLLDLHTMLRDTHPYAAVYKQAYDGSENVSQHREIILCLQDGGLCHISHLDLTYLCLHYVLLFPQGEEGWHLNVLLCNVNNNPHHSKKVTQLL